MDNVQRFFVVAVHLNGSREKVQCGKAGKLKSFAKRIAEEHARTYSSIHHISTIIEEDLSTNNKIAETA